jgi:hypothetical protein
VDLDDLTTALVCVAVTTLQPSAASVWIARRRWSAFAAEMRVGAGIQPRLLGYCASQARLSTVFS